MAEFSVKDKKKLNTAADFISRKASDISSVYSTVLNVRDNLAYQGNAYSSIRSSLSSIMTNLEDEKKSMQSLGDNLNSIADMYGNTETRIVEHAILPSPLFDFVQHVTISDFVKKVGVLGGVLGGYYGAVKKVIDSVTDWSNADGIKDKIKAGNGVGKGAKSVIETSRKAYKWWTKEKKDLGKMFGKNAAAVSKKGSSSTFFDVIEDEISDYDFGKTEGVGEKIDKACAWAGFAFSLVDAGVDNYDQYDGMDNAGYWADTVATAATGIAADAVVKAGVTAGLAAAAAFFGAPILGSAVVVGAATIVVSWGIDYAVRTVSNGEYDGIANLVGDKVGEWTNNMVDSAKTLIDMGKNTLSVAADVSPAWAVT